MLLPKALTERTHFADRGTHQQGQPGSRRPQCENAASLEDFAANRSQWEHFLQIADIEAQSKSKRLTTADQTPPEKTRVCLWKLRKKDLVHQLRYRLRCFHRLSLKGSSNCQHSTKSTNWYWTSRTSSSFKQRTREKQATSNRRILSWTDASVIEFEMSVLSS